MPWRNTTSTKRYLLRSVMTGSVQVIGNGIFGLVAG